MEAPKAPIELGEYERELLKNFDNEEKELLICKHCGHLLNEIVVRRMQYVYESYTLNQYGIEYNDFSALLKFKPEMGEEPKFLNEDGEADYEYGLGYGEFTALNTHMIQKAFKEIEKLKEEIKLLKNNIV